MSPEQAKGQKADRRSDVWAFGCSCRVLAGRATFKGDTIGELLASILKASRLAAIAAETPPAIRRASVAASRRTRSYGSATSVTLAWRWTRQESKSPRRTTPCTAHSS